MTHCFDIEKKVSTHPDDAYSIVAASAPGSVKTRQCLLPDAQIMTSEGPQPAAALQEGDDLDGASVDVQSKNGSSPAP